MLTHGCGFLDHIQESISKLKKIGCTTTTLGSLSWQATATNDASLTPNSTPFKHYQATFRHKGSNAAHFASGQFHSSV
jgi:hypothetical protein